MMNLEELGHSSPLLLCYCCVFLLRHSESGDGQLELHFKLRLGGISL